MSIRTVVTRGYGAGATIAFVVTRGYSSGEAVETAPEVHPPGMRRRAAQIREEDETILAVIMAFLQIKDE